MSQLDNKINLNVSLAKKIYQLTKKMQNRIVQDGDIWSDIVYGLDTTTMQQIVSGLRKEMDLQQLRQFVDLYNKVITIYKIEGKGKLFRNEARELLNRYGHFFKK